MVGAKTGHLGRYLEILTARPINYVETINANMANGRRYLQNLGGEKLLVVGEAILLLLTYRGPQRLSGILSVIST